MERARCPAHGLMTADDGACVRCRRDAARKSDRTTYLVIGGGALAVLLTLAGLRTVMTAREMLAARDPAVTATGRPHATATTPAGAVAATTTPSAPAGQTADRELAIAAAMREVSVVVYTTSYCGWCKRTKAHLDGRGVPYVERRVDTDRAAAAEMRRKFGRGGVPAVDIEGELRQGHNPAWLDRTLRARAELRVGPG